MTSWAGIVGPTAAAACAALALLAVRGRVVPTGRTVASGPPRRAGPSTATVRRATLAVTLATVAIAAGPVAAGALVAIGVLAVQLRPAITERRRRRAIGRELPDAVDLLVLGVHAGLTPRQSVELLSRAAPTSIRPACVDVIHDVERGAPFADALTVIGLRLGPDARSVADVLATADRYGHPLAPVLDQLAVEARASRRRLAEADARRLPVRLSFPLVACTLPSFVLLAIAPAVVAALSSLGGTSW